MKKDAGFKKINSDLFRLIKSLTKSEKRNFKLYAASHQREKGNHFVELFDFIEKSDDFKKGDWSKISFENDKQFYNAQFYLYRFILKSLRAEESNDTVDMELKKILLDVDLLSRKALFDQCLKLLARAEKTALQYQKNMYLQLIWMKTYDMYTYSSTVTINETGDVASEQRKYISKLQKAELEVRLTIEQLAMIGRYFYEKKSPLGSVARSKEMHELSSSELFTLELGRHSSDVVFLNNYLHEQMHFSLGEIGKGLDFSRKNLELYEKNAFLIEDAPDVYQVLIYNYVVQLVTQHAYREALVWVNKSGPALEYVLAKKDVATHLRFSFQSAFYKTMIRVKLGNFEQAEESNKDFGAMLDKWDNSIYSSLVVLGYFYLAYINYGNSNYKKSLKYLKAIYDSTSPEDTPVCQYQARMLGVIIHNESMDDSQADRILADTEDYANTHFAGQKYVILFTRLVKELFQENNSKIRKQILNQMLAMTESGGEEQKQFFESGFSFKAWILSIQAASPFAKVYTRLITV